MICIDRDSTIIELSKQKKSIFLLCFSRIIDIFMKMEILFLIFVIEGCTLEWAGVKLHRPIHGNMPLQIYSHDKSWIVAIYLPYYILKTWNYISLFFTIHISSRTIYNCLSIIISKSFAQDYNIISRFM